VNLLVRLADDPTRAAIFLDIDGTLAPIVPRPEDARVPTETRAELRRLQSRYALVACISGRAGADARRIVDVPELVYVGNHGLELDPEAPLWRDRLRSVLATIEWPETEDKGLSVSLHYRNVADEAAARTSLESIADRARAQGFDARFGRKVLEILPALYAGDDTTDLDAFAALDSLELGVRVAVVSKEVPTALAEAADIVVADPAELVGVLRKL